MDIIRDGDNFFLRDDGSVKSIFKSNNFGWSATVNDELNDKIFWITFQTYKWTSVVIMILSWTSWRVRWWSCVYFSLSRLKR